MKVTFGKHSGKTVEELVLKEPEYIDWVLGKQADGPMRVLQSYAKTLIKKFDSKPLRCNCNGPKCVAQATYATVYLDNVDPVWWCDDCDPYQLGANSGKLQVIRTYSDIGRHVNAYCTAKKSSQVRLLKYFAEAKGLVGRVTTKAREDFFR